MEGHISSDSKILKMKSVIIFQLAVALVLSSLTFNAYAQKNADKSLKNKSGISAADRNAIIAIFEDVDPSKYRLQFNKRKSTYGSRQIKMGDLEQIKRKVNPEEAAGWIVFVVEGDDVIYALAVGKSDLVSVLGEEKALKLNTIMAKYGR